MGYMKRKQQVAVIMAEKQKRGLPNKGPTVGTARDGQMGDKSPAMKPPAPKAVQGSGMPSEPRKGPRKFRRNSLTRVPSGVMSDYDNDQE